MNLIYLDNNATTPICPEVVDAMTACYRAGYFNPASQHQAGRRARQVLETVRDGIGRILGAHTAGVDADRMILTSGGTEANNLALLGLAGHQPGRVIVSAIEHPSVVGPAEELQRRGWDLRRVRVGPDGVVDLDHLEDLLTPSTRLVSIMLGNNETGVLQPVQQAAVLCAARGVALHTDAVQAVGKLPVDFRDLGVSALSLAAHKFHGPRGIGALVLRQGTTLEPTLYGGFQQSGLRPGTEPVALAVGMHKALELWEHRSSQRTTHLTGLRDRLESLLRDGWPELVIIGEQAPRLPHTSSVSFPGLDRQALLMGLDLAGVACSTGSACASGSSQPSPVLQAMGLPQAVIAAALRLSLGALTEDWEIDQGACRILQFANKLRHNKIGRNLSP